MPSLQEVNTIESLLNSSMVTEKQRLECERILIGYERMPPTVEEILESDEYLGRWYNKKHLYPYWREKLNELYPNPIETSGYVVIAKGAIGTGKSVGLAIPTMMIDLIKLSCVSEEAIHQYFGLIPGVTPWTMRFFNVNLPKADEIFGQPVRQILAESPYWQEWRMLNHKNLPCDLSIHMSSRPGHILSEALYGCVISETNFYKQDVAKNIIDTALGRMSSRFEAGQMLFNHLVLDSSDTFEDSAVEQFIKEGAYVGKTKVFHTTSWDAKAHKGIYFNEGEFFVYLGDSSKQPFIIDEATCDKSLLDPDRILRVPKELLPEFKSDIIKSLQDKAGISVSQGNLFFANKDLLNESFSLEHPFEDEYLTDFYDDVSLMDLFGKETLYKLLDPERPLFIRLDLGVKNDRAGLSIAQFSHYRQSVIGDKVYNDVIVKVPFAVGLNRPQGQETPIWKIEDWVLELSQDFDIKLFSTDQYQSTQLRQNIAHKSGGKVPCRLLSVDATDTPHVDFKNMVYRHQVMQPKNGLLMFEEQNLKRMGHKIDHDADKCLTGDTLVKTNNGNKKITDLTSDDLLMSYNPNSQQFEWVEYKNFRETRKVTKIYKITTVTGEVIKCTENHLILTKRGYVRADELTVDDLILKAIDPTSLHYNDNKELYEELVLDLYLNAKMSLRRIASLLGVNYHLIRHIVSDIYEVSRNKSESNANAWKQGLKTSSEYSISYFETLIAKLFKAEHINFERKFNVDGLQCDFYLPKYNLILEVYGSYFHQNTEADQIREDRIKSFGYNLAVLKADVRSYDSFGKYEQAYTILQELIHDYDSTILTDTYEDNFGVPVTWKLPREHYEDDPSYKGHTFDDHWNFDDYISETEFRNYISEGHTEGEVLEQFNMCRNMLPSRAGLWYKTDVETFRASYLAWTPGWNWARRKRYLDAVDSGLRVKDDTCDWCTLKEFQTEYNKKDSWSYREIFDVFFKGKSKNAVHGWFSTMTGGDIHDFIR